MRITDLHDLFKHQLEDLYSTEKQLIAALPEMITSAGDEKLRAALSEHLEVTKEHLKRLDEIHKEMSFAKTGMVCKGIEGIITEGKEGLKDISDVATRNAAIIVSAQRAEHYEIAAYGGAAAFAKQLDMPDIADLLAKTLDEEKQADTMLSKLAEGGLFTPGLNEEAVE